MTASEEELSKNYWFDEACFSVACLENFGV
jgi:hypothetical protein